VNVNDDSERLLRAAMARLLAGTPIRSNGSHTVTSLAAEAGVSRRTASRATGVLRDFQDATAAMVEPPSPFSQETGPIRAELADARTKLGERNAEIRRVRNDLTALACRVALLSEENAQLRAAIGTGSVVALPPRPLPGR
jgi:hypothetical protein